MKTKKLSILLLSGFTMITLSCEKEQFDKDAYDELVDYQFLIDNMDKEHDWCLTQSDTITIVAKSADVYSVQVLTANPYSSDNAEIVNEGICSQNSQTGGYGTVLAYTLPITQQEAFIAAKRNDGSYLGVVSFTVGTETVTLDAETMLSTGTLKTPQPQTFTFLYEEGFPLPGDFDFNDLVLRISKSTIDLSNQVDLKVTVDAEGKPIAVGQKYRPSESRSLLELVHSAASPVTKFVE